MALAAVKGDKTRAELAEQFSVHPTQITEGKQQLLARAADVFGEAKAPSETPDLQTLHAKIGQLALENDFLAGARMLRDLLRQEGHAIGRRQVATLMRRMGLEALYRKPSLSRRQSGHQIYPSPLRDLEITRPNHVWVTDITYIPMQRGFVYLCAILDWASRRVLAWRLSNTLTTDFFLDAVREAIAQFGYPEIFNTDQGCQLTSLEFTTVLKDQGIQRSMDGRGCWRDNVVVERLWRSRKYEEVYLRAYETVHDAPPGGGALRDLLQSDQATSRA